MEVYIATSAADDGSGCQMRFGGALSVSAWHHIVVIFDGSQTGDANRLKMYADGSQLTLSVAAGAVPAALQADGADFNLGKFGGGLTFYMNGRIDEVGIWSKALTSGEVAELYNAGAGKTCCPF
jgi:hypothetical protein